jgi:hypothetical protein
MRHLVFVTLVPVALALAFIGADAGPQTQPKGARDYYKELYGAGGLQKYSQYACFFEDVTFRDYFFTVVFSEELVDSLKSTKLGTEMLKLMSKQDQEFIRKKSAGIYRYNKGVYMNGVVMDKDDLSSWVRTSNDGKQRERFRFQRQTLRFAWTYESLKPAGKDSHSPPSPIFGRCEKIPTDIRQNGENE